MKRNEDNIWTRKRNDGPPDLETLIKKFFNFSKNSSGPSSPKITSYDFIYFLLILLGLYGLSGFYIVREPERAVVTRLGKFYEIKRSGLNWRPRFIDSIYIIDVDAIDSFKKEHVMLTEDENIINAGFEIQYRKSNPQDFLFNDANPILTLNQLTESAIRDIIGHSKLDEILTIGKQEITSKIQKLIEQSLTFYNLGLELKDVNLSFALPPVAVQQAFNDVIKAREDEQAYQNEAERYKESQLPVALGHAQRILFEADSYKKEKILKAQAHAQTFRLLEKEYKKDPRLMKMRLYYETIDQVMSTTTKILVDPDLSHQLIYLNQPYADNLIEEKKATSVPQSPEAHVKINQTHSWPIRLDSPLIASKD